MTEYGSNPGSMGQTIRTIRVSEVRASMLEKWGKRVMELEAINAELLEACRLTMSELGVPSGDYPAPVANAYDILAEAIAKAEGR